MGISLPSGLKMSTLVLVESTGTVCPCLLLARIGHATPIAPLSPLSPPLPSHPHKYWIENFLFFSFSVLSQPVSTIFECFPIVFLSPLSSDSVASLKKLFLSHPTLQQTKKNLQKKNLSLRCVIRPTFLNDRHS